VPLTPFNFRSQFVRGYSGVLFADIRLITISPLIMFGFFQRTSVEGLTAGAVKV
jgi:ABC-type glycerol-3-phosphate transport system permease component